MQISVINEWGMIFLLIKIIIIILIIWFFFWKELWLWKDDEYFFDEYDIDINIYNMEFYRS